MNPVFWTQEKVDEAWERHLEVRTIADLATQLTELWQVPVSEHAVRTAIKRYYPGHNLRLTVGKNLRMREFEERQRRIAEATGGTLVTSETADTPTVRRVPFGHPKPQPSADKHADSIEPGDIHIPVDRWMTVVGLMDGHIPHRDEAVHEACMQFIEAIRPTGVIDVGDGIDLEAFKRHDRSSMIESEYNEEMDKARDSYRADAERYKRANVEFWGYVMGNHDVRAHRWLLKTCPEIYNRLATIPEEMGLYESGYKVVGYGGRIVVGSVDFKHGDTYCKHFAAKELADNGATCSGHTHRMQMAVGRPRNRGPYPEIALSAGMQARQDQRYLYHMPTDHVHGVALWHLGPEGQKIAWPILILDGILRYPLPDGRVLVCDGNLAQTRYE